ncbi:MAG: GNAT family N-acetyltransferase [Oscillibacter sp.]
MLLRGVTMADLAALGQIEAACFPAAEAAGEASFAARLAVYPQHFYLLEEEGAPVAFINGMVTDEETIRDALYDHADLHNEAGAWQTVFGINTLPAYRRRGLAAQLMRRLIADAKAQGRRGCILTCKAALIGYYETFGYQNQGLSASTHGGAVWYDMRLTF